MVTEDNLGSTHILDVMANDGGGKAKTLWPLDDGDSAGGIRPTDLLAQDAIGAAQFSKFGATIKITAAGKVSYDASTFSQEFKTSLQSLGAGEFATDTFTYAIRLANGTLSWATASVKIAGVNDAPELSGTAAMLAGGTEDTAYTVSATDLLAGFSDVDGDTLSVSGLSASNGTVTDNGDGTYTIAPTANFNGAVTLTYNVVDGNGGTIGAIQSYSLAAVNDAPVNTPVALTAMAEDSGARLITKAELLANASDVDGDSLTVTGLAIAAGGLGVLVDNGNDTWSYTPALDDDTAVSFSYMVSDGSLTAAGSATLDITPVNDAPPPVVASLPPVYAGGDPNDFDGLGNPLGQILAVTIHSVLIYAA